MDFSILGTEELQIRLSSGELQELGVFADSLDYADTNTRRVIWDILDTARLRTGFDAAKGRISIHCYVRRDGGCELRVKKLTAEKKKSRQYYYRFLSADDYLLFRARFKDESPVYRTADGLFLESNEKLPAAAEEYATMCSSRFLHGYFCEHAHKRMDTKDT